MKMSIFVCCVLVSCASLAKSYQIINNALADNKITAECIKKEIAAGADRADIVIEGLDCYVLIEG